jgi:DNA processing protein
VEVTSLLHLTPLDPHYPSRLRSLARPPASLTVRGGLVEAARAVAVVGSRRAHPEALAFARELASTLVRAGAVVVSGGALGIDEAAHQGALGAGGRTWAVAGTGCDTCFPPEHAALFETIGRGPGAMVWPFSPTTAVRPGAFLHRNRVLVALSDAVVVAQAGFPSGALRAAECARSLRRPLWVVPVPPWLDGFAGSRQLLDQGVRPLTQVDAFLRTLGLSPTSDAAEATRARSELSPEENAVLSATSNRPLHTDEIALRAHLGAQAAAAALLTLALEAVVVEGPPGFFHRRDSYKP